MLTIKDISTALLHLAFPRLCNGCGSDVVGRHSLLCLRCSASLPATTFEQHAGNPIEKMFYGRVPVEHASAQYYFTKESLVQHLVHELKYKGNKELGIELGRRMGKALQDAGRFDVDVVVPLPLFPAREKKRGFNQSAILCRGIRESWPVAIRENVVVRLQNTGTQTHKGRMDRWENIAGKFLLHDPNMLRDQHMLLVDDVITTGATLEACGAELLRAPGSRLSIACLCYSSR